MSRTIEDSFAEIVAQLDESVPCDWPGLPRRGRLLG